MAAALPKTMRAWRLNTALLSSKSLDQALRLDPSHPLPKMDDKNSTLVKIHAAALNPSDHKIPEQLHPWLSRRLLPEPAIPGLDFSGTVVATATESAFKVGQRVFGRRSDAVAGWGTLCEYVAAGREELAAFPEPAKTGGGVSLEQAAGAGTAALAAYQALVPHAKAGDRVFINGGSGGTGTFGIQIAKIRGCHVTASCSGRNVELCKSLGADEVIDYTKGDVCAVLASKGQVFDLVFDTVGSSPVALYKAADGYLKDGGRFVQVGGDFTLAGLGAMMRRMMVPAFLGGGRRKIEMVVVKNKGEDLAKIAEWIGKGRLRVVVEGVFGFDGGVEEAVRRGKTGRARGKVIVRVEE